MGRGEFEKNDSVFKRRSGKQKNESDYLCQEDVGLLPDNEKKLLHLIDMDFSIDESSSAIDACDDRLERKIQIRIRKAKEYRNYKKVCLEEEDVIHIPKFMIGFGVPNEPRPMFQRKLLDAAIGPPYFYFENVACTLKGICSKISRFLYEIEPEFVDSMHFSAAARKRGKNKAAPLEPNELEMIMGYPENPTRGGGTSQTDRYKALGNAFQVMNQWRSRKERVIRKHQLGISLKFV
ncbi:hypothetical protein IFM89_000652 [Coptis chinensis]|uniref:Uncharacterized protein n=1 Tax=Coptis chinensis TaxID=261450 RepID=A0A835IKE8_9MAGN|nr:hypothetical protein IFM89_000652 [Coptis chinensis]